MNKLDKYKKIIIELNKLYLSEKLIEEGNRFNVIITSSCNFISYNIDPLLFTDTVDKETNYNKILEKCKVEYENYINELIKFKIK